MNQIWQTVLAIIGSVGGAGVIILGISNWVGRIWANQLAEKQKQKFEKEFAEIKSNLERKNYISKTRFEAEFRIYNLLSETVFNMVSKISVFFPTTDIKLPDEYDKKLEIFKKRRSEAVEAYNLASKTIKGNAPFIPKRFYDLFASIQEDCNTHIYDYEMFVLAPNHKTNIEEMPEIYNGCWKRRKEISNKLDKIIEDLREYLTNLDVIE